MRLLAAALTLALALLTRAAGADEPAPAPMLGPARVLTYDDMAPPWWALPPRVTERNSKGLWATGISLWAASGIVTLVGAVLSAQEATQTCFSPQSLERAAPHGRGRTGGGEPVGTARQALDSCGAPETGLAVLAGGFLLGSAAVPIYLLGNKRVRVPGAPAPSSPTLRLDGRGATLRWSF